MLERSRMTQAEAPTQCLQSQHAKKSQMPFTKKVNQRCRMILKLEEKIRYEYNEYKDEELTARDLSNRITLCVKTRMAIAEQATHMWLKSVQI